MIATRTRRTRTCFSVSPLLLAARSETSSQHAFNGCACVCVCGVAVVSTVQVEVGGRFFNENDVLKQASFLLDKLFDYDAWAADDEAQCLMHPALAFLVRARGMRLLRARPVTPRAIHPVQIEMEKFNITEARLKLGMSGRRKVEGRGGAAMKGGRPLVNVKVRPLVMCTHAWGQ